LAWLAVPDSVEAMRLEVNVPERVWRRLTDFGVTVFDAAGHKLSDGPMHYTIGRQTVPLDGVAAGDTVLVELAPAFADPRGDQAWEADLVADFLRERPVDLVAETSTSAHFTLAPGVTHTLAFSWPVDSLAGPWQGPPVVEYRVELNDGSTIRATGTGEPR
jgi:hypothetical protein